MQYTAIIKDGGLFIPNVFSDVDDGLSHIVQVEIDVEPVREQLILEEETIKSLPKKASKAQLKTTQRATPKKVAKHSRATDVARYQDEDADVGDELEDLDDVELSEIFKAYMNEGQTSLENL